MRSELIELAELWKRTMGDCPSAAQFELWAAVHTPMNIKAGIVKTATKNLSIGGTMSLGRRICFASSVMLNRTFDRQKEQGQRQEGL